MRLTPFVTAPCVLSLYFLFFCICGNTWYTFFICYYFRMEFSSAIVTHLYPEYQQLKCLVSLVGNNAQVYVSLSLAIAILERYTRRRLGPSNTFNVPIICKGHCNGGPWSINSAGYEKGSIGGLAGRLHSPPHSDRLDLNLHQIQTRQRNLSDTSNGLSSLV